MALLFIESFEHYSATADMLTKWTGYTNTSASPTSGGRFGNGWPSGQNNTRGVYKSLTVNATTLIFGAAVKLDTVAAGATVPLLVFRDGGTVQCYVGMNAGRIVFVGAAGTILATGTVPLIASNWNYIEAKVAFSDAAGSAVVKVNGVTDINISSVDTKATANAYANEIAINGGSGFGSTGYNPFFDDIYVCDTTGGSPNNDFLGDVRIESRLPNGDGNSSQLVGSDGNSTNNSLLVDEATPNSDTDYVESSTVGNKDTYAYEDLVSTTGTVYGVQIMPYAKKTDAGTRSIVSVARLSGTETDSADKPLTTVYTYLPDIRETKPGGGAWTITDFNSAEFGVKVTA